MNPINRDFSFVQSFITLLDPLNATFVYSYFNSFSVGFHGVDIPSGSNLSPSSSYSNVIGVKNGSPFPSHIPCTLGSNKSALVSGTISLSFPETDGGYSHFVDLHNSSESALSIALQPLNASVSSLYSLHHLSPGLYRYSLHIVLIRRDDDSSPYVSIVKTYPATLAPLAHASSHFIMSPYFPSCYISTSLLLERFFYLYSPYPNSCCFAFFSPMDSSQAISFVQGLAQEHFIDELDSQLPKTGSDPSSYVYELGLCTTSPELRSEFRDASDKAFYSREHLSLADILSSNPDPFITFTVDESQYQDLILYYETNGNVEKADKLKYILSHAKSRSPRANKVSRKAMPAKKAPVFLPGSISSTLSNSTFTVVTNGTSTSSWLTAYPTDQEHPELEEIEYPEPDDESDVF